MKPTPAKCKQLFIAGVGSPHGDDQAGWLVVDALRRMGVPQACLKKLSAPFDLLEHLSRDGIIYICDAVEATVADQPLIVHGPRIPIRSRGGWSTHGPSLADVIELAKSLFPAHAVQIRVATVPGRQWSPFSPPTPNVRARATELAEAIWSEACDDALTQQHKALLDA